MGNDVSFLTTKLKILIKNSKHFYSENTKMDAIEQA